MSVQVLFLKLAIQDSSGKTSYVNGRVPFTLSPAVEHEDDDEVEIPNPIGMGGEEC